MLNNLPTTTPEMNVRPPAPSQENTREIRLLVALREWNDVERLNQQFGPQNAYGIRTVTWCQDGARLYRDAIDLDAKSVVLTSSSSASRNGSAFIFVGARFIVRRHEILRRADVFIKHAFYWLVRKHAAQGGVSRTFPRRELRDSSLLLHRDFPISVRDDVQKINARVLNACRF